MAKMVAKLKSAVDYNLIDLKPDIECDGQTGGVCFSIVKFRHIFCGILDCKKNTLKDGLYHSIYLGYAHFLFN